MSNHLGRCSTSADHTDERPNCGHTSNDVKQPAFVSDLRERIDDDARFDTYTRQLHATDANAYEETPIGVVFPTSAEDTAAVVSYCSEQGVPVLPRGAGTSLAGQVVNGAVVLDFIRYMGTIISTDVGIRYAQVQFGVVLAELNGVLSPHELKFAPNPAIGDRSVIGGAIGNGSTGAHSLKYGKTDAHVEEYKVVLADRTVAIFGETDLDKLRERADSDDMSLQRVYVEVVRIVDGEADEVRARFPKLKCSVFGYNPDVLVGGAETRTVSLARFMAGNKRTLAVVTETKVVLEPVPETKAVSLLLYESVLDAVTDVWYVPEHGFAAAEPIDDVPIGLAWDTADFEKTAVLVSDDAHVRLPTEFHVDDDGRGRSPISGLPADRVPGGEENVEPPKDHPDTAQMFSLVGVEAHGEVDRKQL